MLVANMSITLSEYESKSLLREAGIPVPPERFANDATEAVRAAEDLGYPVALKLCGRGIAHKTERHLVRLGLTDDDEVHTEAEDLLSLRRYEERDAGLLVQTLVPGRRELIAGLVRDPQFGPCVMLGLGGIFAEALGDVAFAVAPLEPHDADDLIDGFAGRRVLQEFRGEPAVDRGKLCRILETLGRIGVERPTIQSIDINPIILLGSDPIVVDALVELEEPS
jgi:acetyl-CoA synthetase (ADP-forming)